MAESHDKRSGAVSSLALVLMIIIVAAALFSAYLSVVNPYLNQDNPGFIGMLSGRTYVSGGVIYDAIYVMLTVASYALYLIGGGVITFGALLVTVRLIQYKLKDPYQSTSSTHRLSGYLTLGLNFFIGAEIIRTVAIREISEFELLILVIFSRGLFSLILYLERRWHGTAETD